MTSFLVPVSCQDCCKIVWGPWQVSLYLYQVRITAGWSADHDKFPCTCTKSELLQDSLGTMTSFLVPVPGQDCCKIVWGPWQVSLYLYQVRITAGWSGDHEKFPCTCTRSGLLQDILGTMTSFLVPVPSQDCCRTGQGHHWGEVEGVVGDTQHQGCSNITGDTAQLANQWRSVWFSIV
jgi:hypothetical protein